MISFFGNIISSYLFPPVCHVCGRALSGNEERICLHCLDELPRTDFLNRSDNPMQQHYAREKDIAVATALWHYRSGPRILVHDTKYHHFSKLGITLGRLMGHEGLSCGTFSGVDALVPVPLHWIRHLRRGYNQSLMLCKGISEVSGIAVSDGNLMRTRNNRSQTLLSHAERQQNKRGLFGLKHPEEFYGKHIMLVDDVFTTGATIDACIDAIRQQTRDTTISIYTLTYAGM